MTVHKQLFKLEDLALQIESSLTKARFVQQEVTQNFFDKWQPMKEADHRLYVAHEYERYGTFSNIVEENLYSIEKSLEELKNLISQVCKEPLEQSSKATTHELESRIV